MKQDPTKDPSAESRFHVELHFSPGVNCCVQKNLLPGPGFRPNSRSDSIKSSNINNPYEPCSPTNAGPDFDSKSSENENVKSPEVEKSNLVDNEKLEPPSESAEPVQEVKPENNATKPIAIT